jgi:hypothetical protein
LQPSIRPSVHPFLEALTAHPSVKISAPLQPMGGDLTTMYGVPLKYVSLVALTLQNTGAVLIMRE